jgi:hypothetical protein
MALALVDPATKQIGIQPVRQRHRSDRHARRPASRDNLGLERLRMPPPPTTTVPNLCDRVHVSTYFSVDAMLLARSDQLKVRPADVYGRTLNVKGCLHLIAEVEIAVVYPAS